MMKRLTSMLWSVLVLASGQAGAESLYREGSYSAPAADHKAHQAGDILTIQVFENASATSSADTGTRRKNNLSAGYAHTDGNGKQFTLNAGGDFDGGGHTQRSNRFLTTLTVSVTAVQPNGDLLVGGEQVLTINDEQQRVNLQGRVRPSDISDGNVVQSTRLADARITYLGQGELSDRQRRSWWRGFLDWMGL
ncbi:flagellar basal body L-ring protein FlgH [Duganella sacchari]|nr:flagellar basal body L-ring protein FlgH [Duganella sacchari]